MLRPEVNVYWRVIASVWCCVRVGFHCEWAGLATPLGEYCEGASSVPEYCCRLRQMHLLSGNVLEEFIEF
jgi:hypothetical protein